MKHRPINKTRKMRLISLRGDRCINCGSPDEVEWHHVVPLEIGGNDVDTNLVPLCHSCHMAVTHHELVLKTSGRVHGNGGRKRTVPNNYKDILHDYLYGRISKTECTKRLGLKNSKFNDATWFREYLKELGIDLYRNNIELKANKGTLEVGSNVGYVKYLNGTKEDVFYNPDGSSDQRVRELIEKYKDNHPKKIEAVKKPSLDEALMDNEHKKRLEHWEKYKREHYAV